MRLIDGTELLRYFSVSPSGERYKLKDCDGFYIDVHLEEVQRRIIDCPSIDAVPVVRCKDCKYYEVDTGHTNGVMCLKHGHKWTIPKPDDFCSYAKEKIYDNCEHIENEK